MLNPTYITTHEQLGVILAQCGFDSDPPDRSPVFGAWEREWHREPIPISRYLRGFVSADFFVVVQSDAFQIYEMDPQNHWFHCLKQIQGIITEEMLSDIIRQAIS